MLLGDPLSRLSTHTVTDAEDNRDQTVLKPEHFRRIAATAFTTSPLENDIRSYPDHDEEVALALRVLRLRGPQRIANNLTE